MIKLKPLLFESKILVSRRTPEEREKRWMREIYKTLHNYIKKGTVGDLDLKNAPIKILPDNLKTVSGNLDLYKSKIEDLNNLEYVGGYLDLRYTLIKKLPDSLKRISGGLYLSESKIEDLNKLEYIGGSIFLFNTPLSNITTKKEIRSKIKIMGEIYRSLDDYY